MQHIWHQMHEFVAMLEEIRTQIGQLYAKNHDTLDYTFERDLEGACMAIEGAERYLDLIADTIVAQEE